MKRRGRRVALTATALGIATIAAASVALKDRAVEEWLRWRLRSAEFPARIRAAERLGEMRSTRAIPEMVALLKESEGRQVQDVKYPVSPGERIACALEKLGPRAIPDLGRALEESAGEKKMWRRYACRTVAKGPAKDSVGILAALIEDGYLCVRGEAILSLSRLGHEATPAVPALRAALDDPDRNVRNWAAEALKKIEASPSR